MNMRTCVFLQLDAKYPRRHAAAAVVPKAVATVSCEGFLHCMRSVFVLKAYATSIARQSYNGHPAGKKTSVMWKARIVVFVVWHKSNCLLRLPLTSPDLGG